MEILFPAGSIKHIDVAIRSGVDAVYGGFKKWNARDKADNFSLSQYKNVLDKLHSHGIKFYLTLNTLMFDNEIVDVLNLLQKNKQYLPDAIIAADLGLITELQKQFPDLPIHLSTQFGVHNSDDMKVAKDLGAERVVLARELTKNAVEHICKNSDLEIECFVYGSQCISFSGQCYFSSLMNGGSGNRGKCEIFCRDNYSAQLAKGNLLYVPDMNCAGVIPQLSEVYSWKLEGRKRNPEQVGQYVKCLKQNELIQPQTGYMYGTTIQKNGLFNEKHLRAMPLLYTSPYSLSGNNISFNVVSNNGFVKEITFVDNMGAGYRYKRCRPSEYITFHPDLFAEYVQGKTGYNVYKISGNESGAHHMFIDRGMLNKMVQAMPRAQKVSQSVQGVPRDIWLETDDWHIAKDLVIKYPDATIVYNIGTIKRLIELEFTTDNKIVYKLPIFNFEDIDLSASYKKLKNQRVMFTHIGQLAAFKNISLAERLTEYTIPVWNSYTLQYLQKQGVNIFTASPELSSKQNTEILHGQNSNRIVYGKLPLVYTRMCFRHLFGCSQCIDPQIKILRNTDKNIDFEVKCYSDYRVILPPEPMLNPMEDGKICRLVVNGMTMAQIQVLLENYTTTKGYTCNFYTKRR